MAVFFSKIVVHIFKIFFFIAHIFFFFRSVSRFNRFTAWESSFPNELISLRWISKTRRENKQSREWFHHLYCNTIKISCQTDKLMKIRNETKSKFDVQTQLLICRLFRLCSYFPTSISQVWNVEIHKNLDVVFFF